MPGSTISADYLVMGAGATGMAFTDSVLAASADATVVLVDRHDRPGGHWNDAYPFVRLHQPSSSYGVGSVPLGSGRIDAGGLNAGYHELAAGTEVVSHFDDAMRHRFLPSGRVRFLPMSEVGEDRVVTSLLSGVRTSVDARRFVDATHSRMKVPSTTPPPYDIAPGVTCVPPNELPRRAPQFDDFVVVGAGKTGMDTCIWLLENGADPDRVSWIVPRDSWVLNRRNVQPGPEFFATLCKSIADQVDAVAHAADVADLFARLEAAGELCRIDSSVVPGAYHCAILADGELEQLRRLLPRVVRKGRVVALAPGEIRLEQGTVATGPNTLFVDCSAAGIPTRPSTPVFADGRITLQWVRTCQPTFSAALIGHVEATFADDDVKNRICTPIVPPTVPMDWLRMLEVELENRRTWTEYPEIDAWLAQSRLDAFTGLARERIGVDADATRHLQRYLANAPVAADRLPGLLEEGVAT